MKETAGQAQSQVKDQATTSAGTVKETAAGAAQDAKQTVTSPDDGTSSSSSTTDHTVAFVVEEDAVPADPTGSSADYTSGRVPPRPTI